MRLAIACALLALVGCGGNGDCSHQAGNYRYTVRPTATNGCGLPEEDAVVSNYVPGMGNPDCQESIDWSPNLCKATFDQNCARSDGTASHRGVLNFNSDGSYATGVETFQFRDTTGAMCFSTIDITYRRL